jgi:hypothetical protein
MSSSVVSCRERVNRVRNRTGPFVDGEQLNVIKMCSTLPLSDVLQPIAASDKDCFYPCGYRLHWVEVDWTVAPWIAYSYFTRQGSQVRALHRPPYFTQFAYF